LHSKSPNLSDAKIKQGIFVSPHKVEQYVWRELRSLLLNYHKSGCWTSVDLGAITQKLG
jgi:hypothetical protein